MAEKFLNLGRGLDIQIHEAKKSLQNFNPKSTSPRHIFIKLSPIKHRISKAAREKNFFSHTKEFPIRLSVDFSTETFQVRKEWDDKFKLLENKKKKKQCLPSTLYPANMSFKSEDEIKTFLIAKAERILHH